MKNKITIIAFILLLSACSSNGGDLPFSVPDDWEHVECPSSDQLDCDLEFPLPKGTEFELQGTPYTEAITSFRHYFPHSFNSAPYFTQSPL